ncbi:MAG TPA: hypothetical protein VEE85_01520 [Candidatus Bathyarchaeia archaeon]|nr:hypothetical protein [Candidatus Bathyarchaeia archaeon]
MKRISILLLAFLFCVVAAPVRVAAQRNSPALPSYTVTDLGTLGGTYSLAGGLSSSGWVEGYASVASGYYHAVLWRNGKITDLGTLGGPNSDGGWRPSDAGDVAGGSETGAGDPYTENYCGYGDNLICVPFFWRHSTKKMTQLPLLGGNNGWAAGVNDFDVIVGNSETTAVDLTCAGTSEVFQFEPVYWINGKIKQLPNFPGDPDGAAFSINFWGEATGYSGNCTTASHALLWQNGKATNLGNLGGTEAEGIDINNWGQVAGLATLPGDVYYHAVLWTWSVPTDLGTLPDDVNSSGDGLNDWGQVVGGSYDKAGNSRAYIWQNGVMTDLNTLIPKNSPLYLLEATGTINDSGQIAGIALQISTGDTHAFLLTPVYGQPKEATDDAPRPHVVVPENVRRSLQQRRPFGSLKGGPIRLQ